MHVLRVVCRLLPLLLLQLQQLHTNHASHDCALLEQSMRAVAPHKVCMSWPTLFSQLFLFCCNCVLLQLYTAMLLILLIADLGPAAEDAILAVALCCSLLSSLLYLPQLVCQVGNTAVSHLRLVATAAGCACTIA
jgi:hypothetical protein